MNIARVSFLLGAIGLLLGDILGITGEGGVFMILNIALLCFSLLIKKFRIVFFVIFFSLTLGYLLGDHAASEGREQYDRLSVITENYTKKGSIIIEVEKKLYKKDRSSVYLGYIAKFDNFDIFDNFDMSDKNDSKSIWKIESIPSVFIEVPENLSIYDGDILSWTGKIEQNITFPLEGYEKYAYFHGGYGRIYMTNFRKIESPGKTYVDTIRTAWESLFIRYFPDAVAGTLLGMTIGSIDMLSSDIKSAFISSGISHILVVSGSNIAFLILLITFFLKYIHVRRTLRILIIGGLIIFYGTLVGWEVSVIRAAIMGILSYTIVEHGSRGSSRAVLALAAIILIIYEPLSPLYDAGFGLSFSATLGILVFEQPIATWAKRYHIPEIIRSIISVSIGAFLGSLPILIYHFEQVALLSIIANLLIGIILGWILFSSVFFAAIASLSHLGGVLTGWLVYIPTRYIISVGEFFGSGYILHIPKEIIPIVSVFLMGMLVYFYIESELHTE